jgi:hypothetical protein
MPEKQAGKGFDAVKILFTTKKFSFRRQIYGNKFGFN